MLSIDRIKRLKALPSLMRMEEKLELLELAEKHHPDNFMKDVAWYKPDPLGDEIASYENPSS